MASVATITNCGVFDDNFKAVNETNRDYGDPMDVGAILEGKYGKDKLKARKAKTTISLATFVAGKVHYQRIADLTEIGGNGVVTAKRKTRRRARRARTRTKAKERKVVSFVVD